MQRVIIAVQKRECGTKLAAQCATKYSTVLLEGGRCYNKAFESFPVLGVATVE